MSHPIEIVSVGENLYEDIHEAIDALNSCQSEFLFKLPPARLRDAGAILKRHQYETSDVFDFLQKYCESEGGHRPYVIAILNGQLRSKKLSNLFGSRHSDDNRKHHFAVVTLKDHQSYTSSRIAFLCYYLIRYSLSFVAPDVLAHNKSQGCFFDKKLDKRDLVRSLSNPDVCDHCRRKIQSHMNPEIDIAVERMIATLKELANTELQLNMKPEKTDVPININELKGCIDIGILTIRDDEFDAILNRFPNRQTVQGKRFYEYSTVTTKAKTDLSVAIARLPRQGQIPAYVVANDMINDLDPQWIFLVGIGGGIPDDEYCLGDVVVANQLNDFCVSAWLQDKPPEFSVTGGLMHPQVEAMLAHLAGFKDLKGWSTQRSVRMKKPDVVVPENINADTLYGSDKWRNNVRSTLLANFPEGKRRRPPKVRTAPVSSSDALIKNADLAEQWQKSARHTEAVEMELAGVYSAAHYAGQEKYRVVAIRGLSDIVGFKRSGEWTSYACNSAAAFAFALINSGIITPREETDRP